MMIIIAFIALLLVVLMQTVYLRRAQVREEMYRAMAAQNLAVAEQARARAELQVAKAEEDQKKFDRERKLRQEALERFNQRLEQNKIQEK